MKSDEASKKFCLTLSSPDYLFVFVCKKKRLSLFFLISSFSNRAAAFFENKYFPRANLGQVMLTFSSRIYTVLFRYC